MSDVVAYILFLAMFVIPGYVIFVICDRIIQAVFENQSLLLSFPFP